MPSPRASVIVPFFDVEPYIDECLASIERQTMRDIEVLLVDDGSTDGSREIAAGYCRRDPRFRLQIQPNSGLAAARNAAVADATGEYVMFVDSDDVLPARAVELLTARLDSTGSSIAVGNACRFDDTVVERSWGQRRSAATDRDATTLAAFPVLASDRIACSKMFRRRFWIQHGYEFPPIRYEDYPVVLAALIAAPGIDCVSAPVYYWRRRTQGASITQQSFDVDNALDRLASAELVLDLVDAHGNDAVAREVHDTLARVDVPAVLAAFARSGSRSHHLADRLSTVVGRLRSPALHPVSLRFAVEALIRTVVPGVATALSGLRRAPSSGRIASLIAAVRHLDLRSVRPASGLVALQLHALQSGDVESLQAYARHRQSVAERDDPVRRSRRRPWRHEFAYPGSLDRPRRAPGRLYLVPWWRHRLSTAVERVQLDGGELVICGTATIDFTTGVPSVALRAKHRGRVIDACVEIDPPGRRFVARFDLRAFTEAGSGCWSVHVEARNRHLRRRAFLAHPEPASRPASVISPGISGPFVHARFDERDRLLLDVEECPPMASVAGVRGTEFELQVDDGSELCLLRTDGSTISAVTGSRKGQSDAVSTVDATAIFDDPPPDDPVSRVSTYVVAQAADRRAVLADPSGRPVRTTGAGVMVSATRSVGGVLQFERSVPEPVVDGVRVIDDQVELEGVGVSPGVVEWRAAGVDNGAVCSIERSPDGWRATLGRESFADVVGRSPGPVLVWVDGRPARLDGFAAATLPIEVDLCGVRMLLGIRGRTLQVATY